MSRYKVGDKVTIITREEAAQISNNSTGPYYWMQSGDCMNSEMLIYARKICTIKNVIHVSSNKYSYTLEGHGWNWTDDMFRETHQQLLKGFYG